MLIKMKRWYYAHDSTQPQTVKKAASDKQDLDFLVSWLAENRMTIEFDLYNSKTKDQLLPYVHCYWENVSDDESLMEDLKNAIKPADWDLL